MPIVTFPVPKKMDDRDPFAIELDAAVSLLNVRTHRERIIRGLGTAGFGPTDGGAGTPLGRPRGFFFNKKLDTVLLGTTEGLWEKSGTGTANWTEVGAVSFDTQNRPSFIGIFDYVLVADGAFARIVTFDGTTVSTLAALGYIPSNLTSLGAYWLLPFNDRAVLVRTNEDGTDNVSRIRWHYSNDITIWDGELTGFLDISENNQDPLTGCCVLGDRAFLFKRNQVIELIATGTAFPVFRQESRVQGTGMLAPYSWASTDEFGFFLGNDNIYSLSGGGIRPVGDAIYKTIAERDILPASSQGFNPFIQGIISPTDSEYWLLDSASGESPNVFIYDYKRDRWFADDYENVFALGYFRQTGSTRVLNTGGTPSTTECMQEGFVVLGVQDGLPGTASRVLWVSPTLTTRDITASDFLCEVVTRDFPSQAFEGRNSGGGTTRTSMDRANVLHELQFRGSPGVKYAVAASNDGGTTWKEEQEVTANSGGVVRAFFLLNFTRIRFRIRGQELTGSANARVFTEHNDPFVIEQQLGLRWLEAGFEIGGDIEFSTL